ncbi:MAG: hypothetical protein OXI74_14085, partial [Rhodospirillaceae bacterium]|nr:hypothetical protein [Rhodospirillaceae bacterium]
MNADPSVARHRERPNQAGEALPGCDRGCRQPAPRGDGGPIGRPRAGAGPQSALFSRRRAPGTLPRACRAAAGCPERTCETRAARIGAAELPGRPGIGHDRLTHARQRRRRER